MNMKLPKRWLHSLGMGLENTILELLSQLIMAKNAPKTLKTSYLLKASSFLEISRLKLRLFLEFHLTHETKIFQIQAVLEEIGKMLGGWIKSLQGQ